MAEGYVDSEGRAIDVPMELCATREDTWSEPRDEETNTQYQARLEALLVDASRTRAECLRQNGIDHFEERFHEDSMFWRFQLTETALVVLVASLLSGESAPGAATASVTCDC